MCCLRSEKTAVRAVLCAVQGKEKNVVSTAVLPVIRGGNSGDRVRNAAPEPESPVPIVGDIE